MSGRARLPSVLRRGLRAHPARPPGGGGGFRTARPEAAACPCQARPGDGGAAVPRAAPAQAARPVRNAAECPPRTRSG
ncbi:MAG: hypothetical protein F4139_13465 [Gemmatimonadetes bacterium]|nr:hypothetical protein [Gemmatimonadota bacterium]MYA64791.1 hypothetical protein [Gemmatimonadota bacterium]MYB97328.1 hypothetical protein [Gemmatimonadota bacterium]MYH53931.1 hypothetical protein [Gemmatimonadota bacterium]MYI47013.1 hypothetical protein [Gemmatimonadota bacterium]